MKIQSVEKYKGNTYCIILENGKHLYINEKIVFEFGLKAGKEYSSEELSKALDTDMRRKAKERALYLLSYRDHSYIELLEKLEKTYIEEIAYMIPMSTDIVIELHCPKVDDVFKQKMIRAIRNNYGMEIDDIDYDLNKVNTRSWIYGIVGVAILAFNLLTEKIIGEVLSNFI